MTAAERIQEKAKATALQIPCIRDCHHCPDKGRIATKIIEEALREVRAEALAEAAQEGAPDA